MTKKNQTDIKKALKSYSEAFQKDGTPIPVNFRTLVPELKKAERFTHLIHSYPAKLLTNIPYFFLATDFYPVTFDRLLRNASIVPAVNQIETHVFYQRCVINRPLPKSCLPFSENER